MNQSMRRCGIGAVRLPIAIVRGNEAVEGTASSVLEKSENNVLSVDHIWAILRDRGIWIPITCYRNWLWQLSYTMRASRLRRHQKPSNNRLASPYSLQKMAASEKCRAEWYL